MLTKEIIKNTFYQMFARMVTSGIGLLIVVIIARYLGVSAYGDFTKVTSYVGIFYLFVDFGLNAIFLKKEENNLSFRYFFYFRILIAIITIFVSIAVSLMLPYDSMSGLGFNPSVRLGIAIFSLSIISQALVLSSLAIFQKKLRYNNLLTANIIGSCTTLIFIILFGYYSLPLFSIILASVAGGFIGSVIALVKTNERILPLSFNIDFSLKILRQSLPIGFMLIFNFIYFRADIFLLSMFQSSRDVGIYGISYKFFDFLIALPLFLSNTIYPTLVKQEKFSNKSYDIKKYLGLFFMFSLLVLIPFWFGAQYAYFIKEEFLPAVVPFRILLVSLPFFFMTSILQWILIAKNKQKFLMGIYFFSMVLNIVLNLIFIPRASYIAASIITGVSEAFVFVFLLIKTYRILEKYAK